MRMESARTRDGLSESRAHRLVLIQEAVNRLLRTQVPAGCVALDGSVTQEVFCGEEYSGMARGSVRAFVAAAALLIAQSSSASAAELTDVSCVIGKATVVHKITTPGTSFTVSCMKDSQEADSPPQVCADANCTEVNAKHLEVACPGGSTAAVKEKKNRITVNCPQLPNAEATVFLLCGKPKPGPSDKINVCAVELQVSPPPPQGPQICAAPGATTTLAIHGETGRTQFACASSGLTALHPTTTGKVFKENCTSEEDLKDLKLTTDTPYKVLAATKKPRTRKLCYVCRAGTGGSTAGGECKIIIDVSAGSGRLERTALGLACSVVLTLLQL